MKIEKIDKWLNDKFGISYSEMVKIKNFLSEENERLKDFNIKLQATKDRLDKYDKENTLRIDKAINKIQLIRDLGFDYDGFNNVKDLKGLIDDLVDLAGQSIDILRGNDNE